MKKWCDMGKYSFFMVWLAMVVSVGGCQISPVPRQAAQIPSPVIGPPEIAALDAEYQAFSTQALTQNYLTRKVQYLLAENKGEAMVRELAYGCYRHPETLKGMFMAKPGLYTQTQAMEAVTFQLGNNPNFEACLTQALNPEPSVTASPPLTQNYLISTIAGTGVANYSGDGGPAASARLNAPGGVAVDAAGNLYIADTHNQRIRKVTTDGVITTVAGTGVVGYSGDEGPATSAQLNTPNGLSIDAEGNLYIADTYNNTIRKVATDGVITTVAGTGGFGYSGDGGQATSAQLKSPNGVAVDAAGNLYITDSTNHRIRKVTPDGIITTVAGTGVAGYSGDEGPAISAQLSAPRGVAIDVAGNLYIADINNQRIRKVATDGTITTVVGTGAVGYSGDGGPATSAQLSYIEGGVVSVDMSGNLYIADTSNQRIRKVTTDGTITTIAGTGGFGYSGDGGQATSAKINYPVGVTVDASGNLYITDNGNNRIRKLAPQ